MAETAKKKPAGQAAAKAAMATTLKEKAKAEQIKKISSLEQEHHKTLMEFRKEHDKAMRDRQKEHDKDMSERAKSRIMPMESE